MLQQLRNLPNKIAERMRPIAPPQYALSQPKSVRELIPYESLHDDADTTYVIMRDGSIGAVWQIAQTPHEVLSESQLREQLLGLSRVFELLRDPRLTLQIIFDSNPSPDFALPDYASAPKTAAQRVMCERIKAIQSLSEGHDSLYCSKRATFLTARLQSSDRAGLDRTPSAIFSDESRTLREFHEQFLESLTEFRAIVNGVEDTLFNSETPFKKLRKSELVRFFRESIHPIANFQNPSMDIPPNPSESLSGQLLQNFIRFTPYAMQLGTDEASSDVVQGISWTQKSPNEYPGMLAQLLAIPEPTRAVLNLCYHPGEKAMDFTETLTKNATDARGARQFAEISAVRTRIAYNEVLMSASLHVFVRSKNSTLENFTKKRSTQRVKGFVESRTGIPFIIEQEALPPIFFLCMPLAYGPQADKFIVRARSVLSGEAGSYMPILGGFPGTRTRSQLMLSRAGSPIYLCSRDCQTSPHIAILASSGAGKSFYYANYMTAEKAIKPESLDFIIDNMTSYEVAAKVFGEGTTGHMIVRPPETYPNVFVGKADKERIALIVSILRTAISLGSPGAQLNSEHSLILKLSIQKAFGDNLIDARTEFSKGALQTKKERGKAIVPRLTDVVDKFTDVCNELNLTGEYAGWLRSKLSPFYGQGQYASLFDQEAFEVEDPPTPSVTIYDLQGVSEDSILSTLVSMICISEVVRQVKRPENRGKGGRLTIEEAGVIGENSPELVKFIRGAWKTFRKLEFTCVGLTNEVEDYKYKPAPRTIWKVSKTKIILPMEVAEIDAAVMDDPKSGDPKLFPEEGIGSLVRTLGKKDGIYSQGLFWSEETRGTFTYAPTGFDYWLAASKPLELDAFERVFRKLGGYRDALWWLAKYAPNGFRNREGRIRPMTDAELSEAVRLYEAS
jgi:type IV secretory pathway VirB4 component